MNRPPARSVAFVLVSTDHGTMLVNRHDYRQTDDGGYGVGHQLLKSSSFDAGEVDSALQFLDSRRQNFGDGVVALDCGANIGVHAIEWARHMTGWGEVVAFEAQERVFYALAGNIAINNCFNARAVWSAVGASSGVIGVPVPDYLKAASFGSLEIRKRTAEYIGQTVDYAEAKLSKTPLVAIDDLQLDRLDFLKIDVEGMEDEVLLGARQTIERCLPQMFIEIIKTDAPMVNEFLSARGYRAFAVGLNVVAIHESDPVNASIVTEP